MAVLMTAITLCESLVGARCMVRPAGAVVMMSPAEVTAPARTGRVALFGHLSASFMRLVGDNGNGG